MSIPNDPKGAAGALKTPLHLIPASAMEETAKAHSLGAAKYGGYNWRNGTVCATTYIGAMLRHLNAWRDGENLDPESGITHLAHIAANCNILMDAAACGTLQDDRYRMPVQDNGLRPKTKPESDPSYRELEIGELIQEGDEYYDIHNGGWCPTKGADLNAYVSHTMNYRRKISKEQDSGYYYVNLKAGDIIQKGDEFDYSGEWDVTRAEGLKASRHANYRRKVIIVGAPKGRIPDLPEGYARWEPRGYGWKSDGPVFFVSYGRIASRWGVTMFSTETSGYYDLYYLEAVK